MDVLTGNSMYMMQKSLDYLWQNQTCILDNIANVETPNYKAKYATFEDSLNRAILTSGNNNSDSLATNARRAIDGADIEINVAEYESTRADDNGVNITEQNVELSRNAYQMQFVMDTISQDYNILRSAIKG